MVKSEYARARERERERELPFRVLAGKTQQRLRFWSRGQPDTNILAEVSERVGATSFTCTRLYGVKLRRFGKLAATSGRMEGEGKRPSSSCRR